MRESMQLFCNRELWYLLEPRAHEAGGTYGHGIIVRRYKKGSSITIRVEITANHRGHFEFRLCKHNSPKTVATQFCLDQHVLKRTKASSGDNIHPTRSQP
ncbi:hypothetical protein J6590_065228 [Homalodisca vitripennis]|nr:hypothetical protein J6590_065228 [Homalodisca vitripennis]